MSSSSAPPQSPSQLINSTIPYSELTETHREILVELQKILLTLDQINSTLSKTIALCSATNISNDTGNSLIINAAREAIGRVKSVFGGLLETDEMMRGEDDYDNDEEEKLRRRRVIVIGEERRTEDEGKGKGKRKARANGIEEGEESNNNTDEEANENGEHEVEDEEMVD